MRIPLFAALADIEAAGDAANAPFAELSGCRPNKTTHQALSLCVFSAEVRRYIRTGWSFIGGSTPPKSGASKSPTYYYAVQTYPQCQVIVKLLGSFRLAAGTRHLHRDCIFTELFLETVPHSLRHSC